MQFKNPYYLLLLLLWIPIIWIYIRRERQSTAAVRYSDISSLINLPQSYVVRLRHILIVIRCLGVGLLIVALARPQKGQTDQEVTSEGVDIICILDISESMRALDFKPENRLSVAKQTLREFIQKRTNDRIGLVIFAARSFTKCPLTLDYDVLDRLISDVNFTDFSNQTAIGTAIATAANRLKDSPSKSKVLILLTDGASNAGDIPPLSAANAAKALGMKIYTIGVGKEGQVPMPVTAVNPFTGERIEQVQMVQSDLDEPTLTAIASSTGGKFFRATDPERLKEIYEQIDKLEKTEIKTKTYTSYTDHFYLWLWAGFILLMIEMILNNTRFRRIP